MRHSFEAMLATGLSVVAIAGVTEQSLASNKHPIHVDIAVGHDIQLYKHPYDEIGAPGPKGPVLELGSKIVAACFARNQNPLISSVRVKSGKTRGYAGIYELEGSKDSTPTSVFNVKPRILKKKLPACK